MEYKSKKETLIEIMLLLYVYIFIYYIEFIYIYIYLCTYILICISIDQGIDQEAFSLLTIDTISELIPKLGDRVKFIRKHQKYYLVNNGVSIAV